MSFRSSMLALLTWTVLRSQVRLVLGYREAGRRDLIQYISANTTPEDKVLVWGAETSVNFFTGRASPTRFVYQYPLHQPGYTSEALILEFLRDLESNPPRLIIDPINDADPLFEFPISSPEIAATIKHILANYRTKELFGIWKIYEYAPILR